MRFPNRLFKAYYHLPSLVQKCQKTSKNGQKWHKKRVLLGAKPLFSIDGASDEIRTHD